MPVWKVLAIFVCGCICLALATATFTLPMNQSGADRWLLMAGLAVATLAAAGLFSLFLRHAGSVMDVKAKPLRR
jgi:hypothetical protein